MQKLKFGFGVNCFSETVFLFIVVSILHSAASTDRMIQIGMNLQGSSNSLMRQYPSICVEGLRKTVKTSVRLIDAFTKI
jgi:hypothetical protein